MRIAVDNHPCNGDCGKILPFAIDLKQIGHVRDGRLPFEADQALAQCEACHKGYCRQCFWSSIHRDKCSTAYVLALAFAGAPI